jgi:hypothetical protein
MSILTFLLIILILLLVGFLPRWPNCRGWGYYPTGGLGLIIIIIFVLLLLGRLLRGQRPRSSAAIRRRGAGATTKQCVRAEQLCPAEQEPLIDMPAQASCVTF